MIFLYRVRSYVGKKFGFRFHPARAVSTSFVSLILLGSALLCLPAAAVGPSLRFIDALFTATSATCVTGLAVIDIGTRLTRFGQIVVLILIQVGGLGIMTFSLLFLYMITRRFSIRGRELLEQTLTQHPLQNLTGLLKAIFIFTFLIELTGAAMLMLQFSQSHSLGSAAYLGIFHSVSAFCNAGYGLFADSLQSYVSNPVVNITIMILIVAGGLGFIVIFDLVNGFNWKHPFRPIKITVHTRIVLTTTSILIITAALYILIIEHANTLSPFAWSEKIMASFFLSITSRTAGFSTVDISSLSNPSLMLLIFLMFIGASPSSCGGGIKTSTAAIFIALIVANFRDTTDINIFSRRLSQATISKALSIIGFATIVVSVFALALSISELGAIPYHLVQMRFMDIIFETVSAFGTVGLSTGITQQLSDVGRLLIVIVMLIGRLGPLTLAIAIGRDKKSGTTFRYPEGSVLVG